MSEKELDRSKFKKTLFIGNGLNRTIKGMPSWNDLLYQEGLSEELRGSNVPNTYLFEQLVAQKGLMPGYRNNNQFNVIKKSIANSLESFSPKYSSIHKIYSRLEVDFVITTNYDTLIENSYRGFVNELDKIGSTRNILSRIGYCNQTSFYHAHGHVAYPNTMCLGLEHYISLINKIEHTPLFMNEKDGTCHINTNLNTNRFSIWPELFLFSDMAIIGYGADYSELDFWWLLQIRKAYLDDSNHDTREDNLIRFYEIRIDNTINNRANADRNRLLRSFGVEVKLISADCYKTGYETICRDIESWWFHK